MKDEGPFKGIRDTKNPVPGALLNSLKEMPSLDEYRLDKTKREQLHYINAVHMNRLLNVFKDTAPQLIERQFNQLALMNVLLIGACALLSVILWRVW